MEPYPLPLPLPQGLCEHVVLELTCSRFAFAVCSDKSSRLQLASYCVAEVGVTFRLQL